MRDPVFTGACPALVTPFHESGCIDYDALGKLIDCQIRSGVDAVCICGTTGESAALSEREQADLIEFCVAQAGHRVKVIAGTGCNNTEVAVDRSLRAQALGADALLVVTPYYNKASQAGLVLHYEAIADRVKIPVILYNVPGRTGVSFTAETYRILARHPNINGVKEASGSLSLITKTRALCPEDFYLWCGNDDQIVPAMSLGAKGAISATANLIPELIVHLCTLCLRGDFTEAAKLQIHYSPLIDALFCDVNPIPLKTAMNLAGMGVGPLRLPLCPPDNEHRALIMDMLDRFDLL